jgi:hypothetical protein
MVNETFKEVEEKNKTVERRKREGKEREILYRRNEAHAILSKVNPYA